MRLNVIIKDKPYQTHNDCNTIVAKYKFNQSINQYNFRIYII